MYNVRIVVEELGADGETVVSQTGSWDVASFNRIGDALTAGQYLRRSTFPKSFGLMSGVVVMSPAKIRDRK